MSVYVNVYTHIHLCVLGERDGRGDTATCLVAKSVAHPIGSLQVSHLKTAPIHPCDV